jgi:hypothetical protein
MTEGLKPQSGPNSRTNQAADKGGSKRGRLAFAAPSAGLGETLCDHLPPAAAKKPTPLGDGQYLTAELRLSEA